MLNVELIYIAADKTRAYFQLTLRQGATVNDALMESGLAITHPEIQEFAVGIFAKQVSRDTILKNGDRVEIYRPLTIDPMQKRRQRAKKQK